MGTVREIRIEQFDIGVGCPGWDVPGDYNIVSVLETKRLRRSTTYRVTLLLDSEVSGGVRLMKS